MYQVGSWTAWETGDDGKVICWCKTIDPDTGISAWLEWDYENGSWKMELELSSSESYWVTERFARIPNSKKTITVLNAADKILLQFAIRILNNFSQD